MPSSTPNTQHTSCATLLFTSSDSGRSYVVSVLRFYSLSKNYHFSNTVWLRMALERNRRHNDQKSHCNNTDIIIPNTAERTSSCPNGNKISFWVIDNFFVLLWIRFVRGKTPGHCPCLRIIVQTTDRVSLTCVNSIASGCDTHRWS